MTDKSLVLTRLHQLYDVHPEGAWSWERLNHALRLQLSTLILVGAPFATEDFTHLAADRRLNFGQWAGADSATMVGERFYRAAVEAGNRAACHSFEAWKQRDPYIWEGQRLYLGSTLRWQGEQVTLTSFAKDGLTVTLCSYHGGVDETCPTCQRGLGRYDRKIKHRYTLTRETLYAGDATRQGKRAPVARQEE